MCVHAYLALDDRLEVVEHFAADLNAFLEGGGSRGNHEELLERQLIARVLAAVDHVLR